ncbi:MAG: Arc family DNA-binding protein [Candidatus Eisenbacteria bacterium]
MARRKAFLLRISPELWDELNRWASQELRSVNGQIEFLLRRAAEERRKGRKAGEGDQTGDD